RRRIEVIGVGDLAGESAAPVLLLVDVAHQRSGVRSTRHDSDLGKASEVFVLVHAPPPGADCTPASINGRRSGCSETWVMICPHMGQVIPFPKRPVESGDRSPLVEVHRCDQREALVVKGLFESEGIPVLVRSRISHSVYPFTVGAQGEVVLLVP